MKVMPTVSRGLQMGDDISCRKFCGGDEGGGVKATKIFSEIAVEITW